MERKHLDLLSAVLDVQLAPPCIEMECNPLPGKRSADTIGVIVDHNRALGANPAAEDAAVIGLQLAIRVNHVGNIRQCRQIRKRHQRPLVGTTQGLIGALGIVEGAVGG